MSCQHLICDTIITHRRHHDLSLRVGFFWEILLEILPLILVLLLYFVSHFSFLYDLRLFSLLSQQMSRNIITWLGNRDPDAVKSRLIPSNDFRLVER